MQNTSQAFTRGQINIIVFGISTRSDPHGNLHRWYHSKGSSTIGFNTGYSNREYDRLIYEAAIIYDIPKAKQLNIQGQRILAEDAQDIFLVHHGQFFAMSTKVQNFANRLGNVPRFHELWLSK